MRPVDVRCSFFLVRKKNEWDGDGFETEMEGDWLRTGEDQNALCKGFFGFKNAGGVVLQWGG